MQFRTKARAVDLLGKGQIADLPTAITELWKNGYDAYADNLNADIYLKGFKDIQNSYFIISDDGKGMSNSDILDKWLVLGTDSKSRVNDDDKESIDTLWKRPRIKAGEKGIGRLSVAYLGSPTLMITKKIGHSYELLFFDWRLLENYNLFLDDIVIPTETIEDLEELPTYIEILKKQFLTNFTGEIYQDDYIIDRSGNIIVKNTEHNHDKSVIWEISQHQLKEDIISAVSQIKIEELISSDIQNHFFESKHNTGTIFLIFNPIDQIIELSEQDSDDIGDRKFVISSLTGFTNPFKETPIKIFTKFFIHKGEEKYDLLTSQGEFFNRKDFDLADVYINGIFDGFGGFKGMVRIYDKIVEYSYINPRKKDARTDYGIVPMEIGYSQGEERSSTLTENEFSSLYNKVREYGGLYIFRDDFRVLPYGRDNFDFLNFDQRRSKRAGTYYFSYRRMFGYLDLTRKGNPQLKDKSSREGLINNVQYRTFSADAINFFITLAQDYFSTEAKESLFLDKKKEINDQFEALKADKAREKSEKISFSKSLTSYPIRLNEHKIQYENLLYELEEKLNNINVSYYEVEEILNDLQKLDIEYKSLIPKVPKRYKPTETQFERLYNYEEQLNDYLNYISPKRKELNEKAQEKLEIRDLKIDFSKRFHNYIFNLEKTINQYRGILETKSTLLVKEYRERSKKLIDSLKENQEEVLEKVISKKQVYDLNVFLEEKYNTILNEADRTLFPLVEHINRLSYEIDEEQVQGLYKSQFDQMKYQWEQTRDTAQLGIAVEIIDHEFNQLYARINSQFFVLNTNPAINSIREFQYLENNFKQLEDKYALLSPLYRISGAFPKEISCLAIFEYLKEFFENQLTSYNIEFTASDKFLKHHIQIKEPVIYTVFINIMNNAVYWVRNSKLKTIRFEYFEETDEIVLANSGEKIPEYRLERIFEMFYSLRPNGRGIGLYLSKQSLNDAGLEIRATNEKKYNSLNGACFVISKLIKNNV